MKVIRATKVLVVIVFLAAAPRAQHANDTLLFTIDLTEDTTSLFSCRWGSPIRCSLSGPVIMQDNTLLFYSRDGYVLFDHRGKILESHSLMRKNRRLRRRDRRLFRLAYPLDRSTLVYYRAPEQDGGEKDIYHKHLFSRTFKNFNGSVYQSNETIGSSQLFNLYNNAITDEMAVKTTLQPHLVGYTSLSNGKRWWSIDKFYSFSSPLILEESGEYRSFFPGFQGTGDPEVKERLIEPLGVFWMNGQWYYYGTYSPRSTARAEYFQKLYLCDQSGNLLYSNTILKQEVVDDVLGENEEEKMLYTVKRASRHVFLPAVDENGDIYYGIIDYRKQRIEVIKRLFYKFVPVPTGPALEDEVYFQQGYVCDLSSTQCGAQGGSRAFLPRLQYLDSSGTLSTMQENDLRRQGYLAKILRRKDDELARTLSRIHRSLPQRVQEIQDSLSNLSTAWCPYSLRLTHRRKGDLATFHYGLGDIIVSARVLCVTNTFEVLVRVDLVDWAEVVVFSTDGAFLNRFRFNGENHEVRNDIIAVSPDRLIVEKDYEVGEGAYRYYTWKLSTVPARAYTTRR
ncbi:MAG: hypothetical protein GF418_05450 [Chitinivibrionales bacterium]|nr:hypothetical protein [Chitinivibrionales bacterium]MBD3395057.1 hypothetical protein [Chitinivibrionales bacterium]